MRTHHLVSAALAVLLAGVEVPAAQDVAIDILPGEARNIVDPASPEPVRVAVLGSDTLDAASIVPSSLRLAGAALVKDAEGRTHTLVDVNGDGRLDLVVQFVAREMLLAESDSRAVLEGTTKDGESLRGEDKVLSLAKALRTAESVPTDQEKLPPLTVGIDIASDSVAVLASASFDPRALPLASIRVNGQSLVKGPSGELTSLEDVDGDGLLDLVLHLSPAALADGKVELDAVSTDGRLVHGEGWFEGQGPVVVPPAPAEPDVVEKNGYPYVIQIPDASPATTYPAIIHVSGVIGVVSKVRVSLNDIHHTCLNDLDVLLVAPNGQSLVLMSDVGGCNGISNATWLTFDDFAPNTLSPGATPPTPYATRPVNNGPGDPFPAPAPAPSGATGLSAFNGIDPNGDWKLFIVDDAFVDSGSIQGGWTLDLVTLTRVCNTTPIGVPDFGAGAPYPSSIGVSGFPRKLAKVTVTLDGVTHSFPDDLDLMLVDPSGHRVMLMSDAGGSTPVSNVTLTLDDDVLSPLPDASPMASVSARPSDYEVGDVFPAPAPGGPVSNQLSTMRGYDPNGLWQLYVADDAVGDSGSIARGWCLNLTAVAPSEMCMPFSLPIPSGAPGTTSGPSAPYPTGFSVSGLTGLVDNVRFRFFGFSHTFPDDVDILAVAPSGRTSMLLSDAGGFTDVSNLDFTIDMDVLTDAPDETPLGPGPYRPTDRSPGDSLPAPAPPAPYGQYFNGEAPNGTWLLYVADDAGGDWGSMSGGWCMSFDLNQPSYSLCVGGSAPLYIPAGMPGQTSGIAFPYPWGFNVPQEGTVIRKVQVRLNRLTHTYPDDLDILLLGPTGQAVMLMSDAGSSVDVQQRNLIFDDEAPTSLPDDAPLVDGTYKPTNYAGGDADAFPAPAPASYGTSLGVFAGTDPKGFWELYVQDDANGDYGVMDEWCLDFFTLYPSAEATNLRWRADKTTLDWDAAANATSYSLLRGTKTDLANLLNGNADSCSATTPQQSQGLVNAIPPPGSFYWYLVVGSSGNVNGPAGSARITGQDTPRAADPMGVCSPL